MMGHRMQPGEKSFVQQTGFTYLMLLFSLIAFGIGLGATGLIWSTESRLAKERELNFIGNAFVAAIGSYYNATPGEVKSFPSSLDELTEDRRFLFIKRHIRKMYANPLTGSQDWKLILTQDGKIQGVSTVLRRDDFEKQMTYVFTPQITHQYCSPSMHCSQ
ncbi:type II secretion system GspH family protein [Limnobacter humi]|uniref:Type II secretion system GspH family protein n=1 Tax=Limnobacter humi TaxID=1778671 RepID=A0ABT1WFF3_9BURK|nr:type II secretion system protein [Limnobacter humi]MCQ8895628.1 type II secretion system GspH family protein [Limnobacter humi]